MRRKMKMVTKKKGPMIDEPKEDGNPLWTEDTDKDLLKTEGPTGNPLWKKKKKKLNEDDENEPERIDE